MTSAAPHAAPESRTPARPRALVTGSTRGLGAAIARELAPTHDLLLGARTADDAQSLAAELPGRAEAFVADLTDSQRLADACAAAGLSDGEPLNVLVHNAGIAELGTTEESTPEQWERTFDINLFAVVELTRLALPALRRTGGHVVFVNSGAGLRANPGWGAYAASKFALKAFADALRGEEPEIRVTSIHPGRIDTEMQRAIVAHEGGDYRPDAFLDPKTVAAAVRNAVETPADAHPVEVALRVR
ncbi:SDR family oxidoreductase [Rhodococcus rhodnii]|uniref:Short chain dehydrogenase n=2 Tax=Rhodococcus rhodnii TaxID=38312 RepID=R7WNQ3_9NOCA|nr:SDR family oxidoreductase [Rhodococcus rhodnii]EOM76905.1 short chain dehydrogenase [Rhodococcus rhodnii LMG 5362]TXG89738.1 SDR family oxidoreductase [Rhodococcus rhodnii]